MKLTGPNRSFGLILAFCVLARSPRLALPFGCHDDGRQLSVMALAAIIRHLSPESTRRDDLVAMARGNTPDPIPNSAVKTLGADGTA